MADGRVAKAFHSAVGVVDNDELRLRGAGRSVSADGTHRTAILPRDAEMALDQAEAAIRAAEKKIEF